MNSLQCSFSENVLYYQGILQIGRFIFQYFYRIPGDHELVASVDGLVQILNQKYQHFSNWDRGWLQTVMSVIHVKEKKRKSPHTCGTNYVYYQRSVLALIRYRRCLRLCSSVCQSRACQHDNSTRDPFKLRSPNLDQRYKTTWLCISVSKSPHSNNMYVQFLPCNSLRLRDGWLFKDDIFQCIFRWKFLNLDRNLLTFIAKGPIDHK